MAIAGAPAPQGAYYQLRSLDVTIVEAADKTWRRSVDFAIVHVPFDQPLFVQREGGNATLAIDDEHPANDLYGLAELRCGSRTYRSPRLPAASANPAGKVPLTLIPLRHARGQGIGRLFTAFVRDAFESSNAFVAVIVLSWSDRGRKPKVNLRRSALPACSVAFLPAEEQTHTPRGSLASFSGEAFVPAPVPLPKSPRGGCRSADAVFVSTTALDSSRVVRRRRGTCMLKKADRGAGVGEQSGRGGGGGGGSGSGGISDANANANAKANATAPGRRRVLGASDAPPDVLLGLGGGTEARSRAERGEGGVVTSTGTYVSALELDDMVTSGVQIVDKVVEPATNAILAPAVDQMAKETMDNVEDQLVMKMGTGIKAKVPTEVAQMLDLALTYNLTNLLTDSITASATAFITTHVTESVVPTIHNAMVPTLIRRIAPYLTDIIPPTITQRLAESLPEMLHRTLRIRLTHSLTRSVTHALVPTLVKALTHNEHQAAFCHECASTSRYCNLCHYSASSEYYTNYYASYYSDYFSDFYADYYAQSLHKLDLAQHPRRKWTVGDKPGDPKAEDAK